MCLLPIYKAERKPLTLYTRKVLFMLSLLWSFIGLVSAAIGLGFVIATIVRSGFDLSRQDYKHLGIALLLAAIATVFLALGRL